MSKPKVMKSMVCRECSRAEVMKAGKERWLIWVLLVFLSDAGYTQKYPAWDAATAGASAGASGYGRFWGNPSAWADLQKLSAGQYYQQGFLLKELAVRAAGLALPAVDGTFAATVISEGYSMFGKTMLSAGYARYFGKKVSAGLAVDYLQLHIAEGYGQVSGAGTHFGLTAGFSPKLKAATWVFFPAGGDVTLRECFQPFMLMGLQWNASGKLVVVAEMAKESQSPVVVRGGMYYSDKKHLLIQGGLALFPASYYAGAGIISGRFTCILNSVYRSPLGFSPSITLLYEKR